MRRVHGEATECVVFIGRQRNMRWKRGLAYCRTEETALCSTGHVRNGGPVDREGCGVPQNGGNRLVLERYGRNGSPVHREGCGVPQNGTPRDTVHLHRRPPPASTGYCSSTIDLLQPPPVTVHPRAHVHPRAPVHPASTARYSTGYCSTSPLHGLLFNHPSMGCCSSCPPPSTVHPALHRVVLFIQHSTGSCSSSRNQLDRSGSCSSRCNTTRSCSSTPTRNCSSKHPSNAHCSSREGGSRVRSASVSTAVAKESLGFSNA